MMVRPGAAADAGAAVPLMMATMGAFATHLFGSGEAQRAAAVVGQLYCRPRNRFSGQYATVVEIAGRLAGILVSYPASEMPRLDLGMARHLFSIYGAGGFARFVGRALPLALVREAYPGEYFINSLATAPDLRGQGIGSRLLAWAEDKARAVGCAACALSVALDNQRARALYERQGYRLAGMHRFGDGGFYRMVKGLDGSGKREYP